MAQVTNENAVETMISGDPNINVLGVPVTNVTKERALEILFAIMDDPSRRPQAVYFVNAHTLNVAAEDPEALAVLRRGRYIFGDGTGVRWAARMLYNLKLRDNVNGTDLTPLLFQRGQDRGYRYFLLGSTPDRIPRAAKFIQDTYPGWTLAGYHHGYLQRIEDTQRALEHIRSARPHLLLVGMGNPLQEKWIDRHLGDIRVPLCMGTGGLFDYWSGDLDRAPEWMRRIGYEWLHLMIRQPRRKVRRYLLGNPKFLARVAAQRLCTQVRDTK